MNTPEDDERELIDRAQAGEAIAFERLVEQHAARLWRCGLALGKDRPLGRGSCTRDPGRSVAILGTFRWSLPVLHLAIRHSTAPVLERTATPERRQAFRTRDALAKCHALRPRPIDRQRIPKMRQRIRRAVASLPEEHRLVVELRFFAGATLDEIAAALGCPLGTVKSRLHHALEKLRQMNLAVNLFTSSRETRESRP